VLKSASSSKRLSFGDEFSCLPVFSKNAVGRIVSGNDGVVLQVKEFLFSDYPNFPPKPKMFGNICACIQQLFCCVKLNKIQESVNEIGVFVVTLPGELS